MKFDEIKPQNYVRAFCFKNLRYLSSDITLSWYKRRDFLTISQNGMFSSYIGKKAYEKALQNGKEIFSNEKNFKIFEEGFRRVILEMDEYLSNAKKLEKVKIGDFLDLRYITNKVFYYFEKTEFFFTDLCYAGEMSQELRKNLFILGNDLKVKARPLIVELITTVPYRFCEIVAKENSLNPEDLKSYTFDEIITLLETGKKVVESILKERKESFVVYSENGSCISLNGEDKIKVLREFKENIDYAHTTQFKGTVANKGRVVARAKVIIPELDQDYGLFVKKLISMDMNDGDILVTETTSPDFFLLMKKAGGIIANQGGMNSHAAIMSRELKIPCIVGAHIATDVLKTGDLIELDADSGIVRIIERFK